MIENEMKYITKALALLNNPRKKNNSLIADENKIH